MNQLFRALYEKIAAVGRNVASNGGAQIFFVKVLRRALNPIPLFFDLEFCQREIIMIIMLMPIPADAQKKLQDLLRSASYLLPFLSCPELHC